MSTGFTQVTASHLQDATGTPITNATISFLPVANNGVPLSFRAGGAEGQVVSQAVTAQVTNGSFTIILADTSLTTPVNVGYRVSVLDNNGANGGKSLLGNGYLIQPTGDTWSLDTFIPLLGSQITLQAGPEGKSAYQVYQSTGGTLSVTDWLLSLQGDGISADQLASALTGQIVTSVPPTTPVATTFGSLLPASQVPSTGGVHTWFLKTPLTVAAPVTSITVGLATLTQGAKLKFVLGTLSSDQTSFTPSDEWEYTIPNSASGYSEVTVTSANGDFAARSTQVGQTFGVFSGADHMVYGPSGSDSFLYATYDVTTVGAVANGLQTLSGSHTNITLTVTHPGTAGSSGTSVTLDPLGYVGVTAFEASQQGNTGVTTDALTSALSGVPVSLLTTPASPAVVTTYGSLLPTSSNTGQGGNHTWFVSTPIATSAPVTSLSVALATLTAGAKLKFVLATPTSDRSGVTIKDEWEYTIPSSATGYSVVNLSVAHGDFAERTANAGDLFGVYSSVDHMVYGNAVGSESLLYFTFDATSLGQAYTGAHNDALHPDITLTVTVPAVQGGTTVLDPLGYQGLSSAPYGSTRHGSVIAIRGSSIERGNQLPGAALTNGGQPGNWGDVVGKSAWAQGVPVYNDGQDGYTSAQDITTYTQSVGGNPSLQSRSPRITGNTKRCYLFMSTTEVTNDYNNGISTAQSIANLQQLSATYKADGWYLVYCISPIFGNGPEPVAAQAAQNRAVNDALYTGVIACDLLIDFSKLAVNKHSTVFYFDGTHPTALLHSIMGNHAVACLIAGADPTLQLSGGGLISPDGSRWLPQIDNNGSVTYLKG